MAVLGLLFVGGLYLDGWAHNNGRVDDSFFTPWHAVLYSAFALNFLTLAGVALVNRARGSGWAESLPKAYWLSLAGLGLWFVGGPGDLIWHSLFGVEQNFEALYSPTHLLLATGGFLAVSGPFRAMWARRESPQGLLNQLPMTLSLLAAFSGLTFFTQHSHPVPNPWGLGPRFQPDIYESHGVLSWMFFSLMLMGALLLTMRRWRLAPGSFTLLIGLNAFGMGFQENEYRAGMVGLFVAAGVATDLLYARLRPSSNRPTALRMFAFLVPVLLSGLVFVVGGITSGIGWSIHLAGGTVFLTGIMGLLLSVVAFPPAIPSE